MLNYSHLWEPIKLASGQTIELSFGALHLWIHRGHDEWFIANEYEIDLADALDWSISEVPFVLEREWTRWVLDDQVDCIQLRPQLPNRPIIVRPEMAMCLTPQQSVRFFVGLPISLQITLGSKNVELMEIPTQILSNSWFGSVTEGELCYALKTTAKRKVEQLLPAPHRAVFPLEIRNHSTEMLRFERLCLRAQHLKIYQGKDRIWTSHGRISYRGEDKWSRFVYANRAPDMEQSLHLLADARTPAPRGLLLNSFGPSYK